MLCNCLHLYRNAQFKNKDRKPNHKRDDLAKDQKNIKIITAAPPAPANDLLLISDEAARVYAKREITSNWDRFNENTSDSLSSNYDLDNEQLNAADFSQLLMATASVGAGFVFKSEKNWSQDTTQYFQLDLNDITNSLCSIPFYERLGYGEDCFTEDQLSKMDRLAKQYQSKCAKKVERPKKRDATIKNTSPVANISPIKSFRIAENVEPTKVDETVDDELDALLDGINLKEKSNTITLPTKVTNQIAASIPSTVNQASAMPKLPQTDIQQWLDDILENP